MDLEHPIEIKEGLKKIFKSDIEFSEYIENLALSQRATVLDTLIMFCEENGVEPERIRTMVSQSLRDKLRVNFVDRGLLKAESSLDSFFN